MSDRASEQPVPLHVSRLAAPHDTARLLLISYHFPPSSAAGALRWQKLGELAGERGWALDVITLDPAQIESPDWTRLEDLSPGCRVYGVHRRTLARQRVTGVLASLRRRVRARRASPTGVPTSPGASGRSPGPHASSSRPGALARAYNSLLDYALHGAWAADAAVLGLRLARSTRYDAVVSCGPPHMPHAAAHRVAGALGIPFVMDLRDPWSLVERLADVIDSPLWRMQAARHERRLMRDASLIVANTEGLAAALRTRYRDLASRVIAVMNGFDDEPLPRSRATGRFLITYSGSIYLDRDPRPLLEAIARVVRQRRPALDELGVLFVGNAQQFGGRSLHELARDCGLDGRVMTKAHMPRHELMSLLADSTVLVSLPQDSHLAIPSKIFEYMQFEAWLLALAEPHSATARLLAGTAADVVPAADIDGIARILLERFDAFRRGERASRLADDPRFGRRHQAGILFDALEEICLGSSASPSSVA